MPAAPKHFPQDTGPDPRPPDHGLALDLLAGLATASDAGIDAALHGALARIAGSCGADRAILFRLTAGTLPQPVLDWHLPHDGPPPVSDATLQSLRQSPADRFAAVGPADSLIFGASFGTDQDGGLLMLSGATPDADLPKPVFDAVLALLQRREKAGQDQLRGAFATLPDGFVLYDAGNRLIASNTRFRDFYGIPATELPPGTPQAEVTRLQTLRRPPFADETGRAQIGAADRNHIPPPGSASFERTLPDGRVLRITEQLIPTGARLELHTDITDLKRAEQRLLNVIEGARVCTWEWNIKTNEQHVNRGWAEILGYRLEELGEVSYDTWRSTVHPDDLPAAEALISECFSGLTDTYEAEYRQRHKDGSWIWILDRGRITRRDPDGVPEFMVGVQIAIGEQRAREDALLDAKLRLEHALADRAKVEQRLYDIATVSDGWLWEMDSDCRYTLVLDGEFFDDGGVPPEGLLGKTQHQWLAANPDMLPGIEWGGLLADIDAHRPFRDFLYRAPKSVDGVVRWRRMTGKPIFDGTGTFTGYRGVGSDVTQLYLAKASAEEASRTKSMFLANMSHEIRTPLNGVLGMAEVLDGVLTNSDHKRMIGTIRRSGESLLNILNDILDMSKIEAGKLELENVPFSLEDLAERVEELHALRAEEKGLAFEVLIGSGSEVLRTGDPLRVQQILHNLVSNAIKFTQKGEVTVKILGRGNGPLTIEVRDTGIGMTEDQIARVHDEFSQADASVTRRFGGTGLGMAITRTLVEMMGGTIAVTSEPGEGTTILVTLPLPVTADGARDGPDLAIGPVSLQGLRVLAADDNATNRAVLEMMLTRRGAEVVLVADGAQAVEAWAPDRFDIVLLDIAMPGVDGPTALREIRAREASAGCPPGPIIAVTANAMSHQIVDYLMMGFDSCISKPVTSGDLAFAIATLVAETRKA